MKVILKGGGWAVKYTGNNKAEIEAAAREIFPDIRGAIQWQHWQAGYWLLVTNPADPFSVRMHKGIDLPEEYRLDVDGMTPFTRNIMKDWFNYR